MKHILLPIFIFLISLTTYAADYYDATVVFIDGKSKKGLVESTLSTDYILFKSTKDSKEEKIQSSTVSNVIFNIKNETREFHILKVYLGWGQKRISDPMWLKVVEKGIATLYVNQTTMSSMNGLNSAGFLDYYVIRAGEPAAKMIANISTLNNNQTFRAKAPLYFEDYPELAAKIKSKEYTWEDLTVVVQEYNKWAVKKK
ncbi:MAG: hypothetical protein C0490_19265 [Marivirga sp.]|nr:hypothetical protein [Marivirga sp.]